MMLNPGSILQNRYQILRVLGVGGMGAVYLAQDSHLRRMVAIKENSRGDPAQFQEEALLLAHLNHPNLPEVYDHFSDPNGSQYLIMSYVEGEDLAARLAQGGPIPERQALGWLNQILDAVAYLHSQGVIHRDIKPSNIKLTPGGQVVLVDFGIAKVYQPGRPTVTGARAATPGFAAPEQYGGGTDPRSDIYSLGATLYALLTGREPPDSPSLVTGSAMLVPPRQLNLSIAPATEALILRAMANRPDARFQTAAEMRQALTSPARPSPNLVATRHSAARADAVIQPTVRTAVPAPRAPAWLWGLLGVVGVLFLMTLALYISGGDISEWIGAYAPVANPSAPAFSVATVVPAASSSYVTDVVMAQKVEGANYDPIGLTTRFTPDAIFHAVATVTNAPANSTVRAEWFAQDVGSAAAPNSPIDQFSLTTSGSRNLDFILRPKTTWPTGFYRVDLYADNHRVRSLNFSVTSAVLCPAPALDAQPASFPLRIKMAQDAAGDAKQPVNPTRTFSPNAVLHAIVSITGAPASTAFKATWYEQDTANGETCNRAIKSVDVAADGTRNIDFFLRPDSPWPSGTYRVDIEVNGKLAAHQEFVVQ